MCEGSHLLQQNLGSQLSSHFCKLLLPCHAMVVISSAKSSRIPHAKYTGGQVSLFTPNKVEYLENELTYDLGDGLVRFHLKQSSGIVNSHVRVK